MDKTCAFFGHHIAPSFLEDRIYEAAENLILNCEVKNFYVNRHGNFDEISLQVLRRLREKYPEIQICVVVENPHYKRDEYGNSRIACYDDYEVVSFVLDNLYFKASIDETNKKIAEICNYVICWVDMSTKLHSGAQRAVCFAKKLNKKIINLWQ